MKKYIVTSRFTDLGVKFDRREDAVNSGKAHDARIDAMTGFSKVFGHVQHRYDITRVTERPVGVDEYLEAVKRIQATRNRVVADMENLFSKLIAKDRETVLLYNNQQPYHFWDKIELVIRPKGAKRNKKLVGIVCDTVISKDGEVRPTLRGMSYPIDAKIVSIKVL